MDNRKELIEKILDELNGRSGFDDWWCNIDEDTQEEITETLVNILPIHVVSNCNAKKDTNIENTILLISRKDGLTDVYDNSGCLGKGLDTQGINDLNIT